MPVERDGKGASHVKHDLHGEASQIPGFLTPGQKSGSKANEGAKIFVEPGKTKFGRVFQNTDGSCPPSFHMTAPDIV